MVTHHPGRDRVVRENYSDYDCVDPSIETAMTLVVAPMVVVATAIWE
jgi:hypothetical protein